MTFVKYNININQRAALELGADLDIVDLAIFDFIKDFIHSGACTRTHEPGGEYFWISYKLILEGMPLLKIKSRQGLSNRIDKLVNAGIIDRHPENQKNGRSLYKMGENYEVLIFLQPSNKTLHPPQQNFTPPAKNGLHYNNINDNTQQISMVPASPEHPHPFSDNTLSEYEVFEKLLSAEKEAGVDVSFYYSQIKNWAQGKTKPVLRSNWKKVIVSWLQRDRAKNKLVMQKTGDLSW